MISQKRNDPCACGSGKKYKQCCLNAISDRVITAGDECEVAHQKIRNLSSDLIKQVEEFSADFMSPEFGSEGISLTKGTAVEVN